MCSKLKIEILELTERGELIITQLAFTCSKSTVEIPEKCEKSVQS